MRELPPLLRNQRKIDTDHLKLLFVFHFVGAGLAAVGLLFLLFHFTMFNAFFSNPEFWDKQKQAPPPAEMFAMFKWF